MLFEFDASGSNDHILNIYLLVHTNLRSLSLSGRTVSASGATGPFRAFPKSLSVDFGGLNHPQPQPLPQSLSQPQQQPQQQQQQPVGIGQTTPPVSSGSAQDRYAAVSQLDSVFSETTVVTGTMFLSVEALILFVSV